MQKDLTGAVQMRRLSLLFFEESHASEALGCFPQPRVSHLVCGYALRSIEFEPIYLLDMLFTLALLSRAVKTFAVLDAHS